MCYPKPSSSIHSQNSFPDLSGSNETRTMTTRSSTIEPDFFGGPEWPEDNSSEFECDSSPGSPTFSSGYKSVISDDLDLYDARYVC